MAFANLHHYSPNVEELIDSEPLMVPPSMPLRNVLDHMSHAEGRSCAQQSPPRETPFETAPQSSCALIVQEQQLLGIFTERDLVRLTAGGQSIEGVFIADAMSVPLVTLPVHKFRDVFTTLALMRQEKIRHLPVEDDQGHFVGLITTETLRKAIQPINLLGLWSVGQVMIDGVIWMRPNTPLIDIAQKMSEHAISCIVIAQPLTSTQNHHAVTPLGIITERDIVQYQVLALNLHRLTAEMVMSTPLFCAHPEDNLWAVHEQMGNRRIRRLVVISETVHGRELQGIVTQSDLLRSFDPIELFSLTKSLHQDVCRLEAEKVDLLQKQNRHLEQEVQHRTAELEQLNQSLEIHVEQRTAALEAARQKADQANRAKSEFLASMSHELRTPLNAILGFSQLMGEDQAISTQQQNTLQIINRSGEHLLELINDVLDMSKIEAGRTTLNPADFNLHGLLQSLYDMFNLKAQSKGLKLALKLDDHLPQFIHGDESKLRQVLINLIGNAIKFTEAGEVSITAGMAEQTGDGELSLTFAVEDSGPGIAPDEVERIFDPFIQAKSSQAQQGTGLGLAISAQFVRLMKGDISVCSKLSRGSIFRFTIGCQTPLSSVAPRADLPQVMGLAPGQPTYRILVVEDHLDSQLLLQSWLTSVGFEVKTANNGREAVSQFQAWHPHLIWMDMRMPVMDGMQATRAIRALVQESESQAPEPVILALTASVFEENREKILSAGCNKFVRKPYKIQEIYRLMADFLEIEYLYRSSAQSSTELPEPELSRDCFQQLPSTWISRLRTAAMQLDIQAIEASLEELTLDHPSIKTKIQKLANDFRFDVILELTQGLEATV